MQIVSSIINLFLTLTIVALWFNVARNTTRFLRDTKNTILKHEQLIRYMIQHLPASLQVLAQKMISDGPLSTEDVTKFMEEEHLRQRKIFLDWCEEVRKRAPTEDREFLNHLEQEISSVFDLLSTVTPESSPEYRAQVMENVEQTMQKLSAGHGMQPPEE